MSTHNHISKTAASMAVRSVIEQNKGGKLIIDRIMDAYGFTTKLALCKHLGVSQSTLANRYLRDTISADWVIICHVETGANLGWLLSGAGAPFKQSTESSVSQMRYHSLENGKLIPLQDFAISKSSLPANPTSCFAIQYEQTTVIVDESFSDLNDGLWVIEIDGFVSVRELSRLPGGRVRVENGKASFECLAAEIKTLGRVVSKLVNL
ncbi:phage repressor protein CI [Cronobacter dublinensis]